jgi:uncharacterized membrane protein YedE/YeeE
MKTAAVAFVAGLVFAIGLGVSGMTNPQKIISFLDVAGTWDPSLAFVMIGAVGVHIGPARWALRARRPIWANAFALPTSRAIDTRVLVGAAIFGLGWGTSGYCPGPALVAVVNRSASTVTFVASMILGTLCFHWLQWTRVRLFQTWSEPGAPAPEGKVRSPSV